MWRQTGFYEAHIEQTIKILQFSSGQFRAPGIFFFDQTVGEDRMVYRQLGRGRIIGCGRDCAKNVTM